MEFPKFVVQAKSHCSLTNQLSRRNSAENWIVKRLVIRQCVERVVSCKNVFACKSDGPVTRELIACVVYTEERRVVERRVR